MCGHFQHGSVYSVGLGTTGITISCGRLFHDSFVPVGTLDWFFLFFFGRIVDLIQINIGLLFVD